MFLALLDRRIEERAVAQRAFAERLTGIDDYADLTEHFTEATSADSAWTPAGRRVPGGGRPRS